MCKYIPVISLTILYIPVISVNALYWWWLTLVYSRLDRSITYVKQCHANWCLTYHSGYDLYFDWLIDIVMCYRCLEIYNMSENVPMGKINNKITLKLPNMSMGEIHIKITPKLPNVPIGKFISKLPWNSQMCPWGNSYQNYPETPKRAHGGNSYKNYPETPTDPRYPGYS